MQEIDKNTISKSGIKIEKSCRNSIIGLDHHSKLIDLFFLSVDQRDEFTGHYVRRYMLGVRYVFQERRYSMASSLNLIGYLSWTGIGLRYQ